MQQYDVIIRNGTIYDGSGGAPYKGDVAIQGDVIAAVGDVGDAQGKREIDVNGLAVAPGFINMLSWSVESLIEDGRSQSEIRQGVTLEVMGEGTSMGPMSDEMKAAGTRGILGNDAFKYDIEWTTLGEYLEWLEKRGVSTNIASFVGSSTLRIYAMGYDNRQPSDDELVVMRDLLRQAMEEGAVGMSAALIYPPAAYAEMDELINLTSVLAEYDGLYISHVRGEGSTLLDAIEELIEIADINHIRAEVYHLKAAGPDNWPLMDEAIDIIEEAREDGLAITADVYSYDFSGTGLAACIPPWAHEGGDEALYARLNDPLERGRIKAELLTPSDEWENMFLQNGPEKILLADFRSDALKQYSGKTLAEVSALRGTPPEDTLMDLIAEDQSHIFSMYFTMSEENLRKQIALPWVSFCSDAQSQAPEGVFLNWRPHPRAYGSFARVLGKYVRDEKIIPLEEAVRRLTSFPAANLKIEKRGSLKPDYFADVVIFDPATIQDHATPENPHQYATGMQHVFVNGVQVLENGEHTGAKPGRVVRGPGWKHKPFENQFPPELHPFLTLGGDYDGLYDEFNIGKALVPDLIRMATDDNLLFYEEERPQGHAPMHAWRRLAQLGAVEAAEPLLKLLIGHNLRSTYEIPAVYAMFGMKAFPVLANYLTDTSKPDYARIEAMNCMTAIVEESPDATQTAFLALEGLLISLLQKYRENERFFNAGLLIGLVRLESFAALPLITEVFNYDPTIEELGITMQDIAAKLNIPVDIEEDNEPDHDHHDDDEDDDQPLLTSRMKADAKKKKAKRKQANKIKKLNRKKKR